MKTGPNRKSRAKRTRPSRAPGGSLDVLVLDDKMQPLPRADVRIIERNSGHEIALGFVEQAQRHRTVGVPIGEYALRVRLPGRLGVDRNVIVTAAGGQEVVVLGRRGQPAYWRGKVRVPFEPRPEMIATTLRSVAQSIQAELDDLERELGLVRREIPRGTPAVHLRLFELPPRVVGRPDAVLSRLAQHPAVINAGQLVNLGPEVVSFLTGEILVKFRTQVTDDEARQILGDSRVSVIRAVPYSANTFHGSVAPYGRYQDLDLIERFATRPDVEWAEPNLVTIARPDSINPSDYLWTGVWDRQLVSTPDAWQHLQDTGHPAFGEPGILLAIPDQGIVTSGGAPVHPEFQGALSDGRPKVAAFFDFVNMVPNHDSPQGDHGMGTGGTSTSRADNPSPVPGVNEGLAGAAPNVQLLAMIPSFVDSDIADMYIWAAGFDPHSPRAGAPAPRSQGADVFSSSMGFGAGAPISGTASAMLDFITTFGRNGRGCVTFQSAGNLNIEFTTWRPYAAYERSIAVGASTLTPTGAEVKTSYSDWGLHLGICAPSNSGGVHNPPSSYGVLSCDLPGQGNLFGHSDVLTSLSQPTVAGAMSIKVASVMGLTAGMRLIIGAPGAVGWEPAMVSMIDPTTSTISLSIGLLNPHTGGTIVAGSSSAGYTNVFGGTSSATPLSAGVACLILSANSNLTWIEVRQLLRDTAHKIDPTNTDPIGQWIDVNGNPSRTSGLPPLFSQWYGYGRVDAAAAVAMAATYFFAQEMVVRDNLADVGTVPTGVPFWDSPDIWVRNLSPAVEGAAALPAGYGVPGPHQNPIAGQDNWVYVRYKNLGSATSLDFYIRASIAHYPGMEFTYPNSFVPSNRPGTPVPSPMTPGTYLIGQVKDTALPAGVDRTVNFLWPQALIPPQTVLVGGTTVIWHPCLLVEVSPHDGPPPSGPHVWDSNDLSQKNVSIVYAALDQTFDIGVVIGSFEFADRELVLEVDRTRVPISVQLFVDLNHAGLEAALREVEIQWSPGDANDTEEFSESSVGTRPAEVELFGAAHLATEVVSIGSLVLSVDARARPRDLRRSDGTRRHRSYVLTQVRGHSVALLTGSDRCRIPVMGLGRTAHPIRIGGLVRPGTPLGEYPIHILQRDTRGRLRGGAEIRLIVGARKR